MLRVIDLGKDYGDRMLFEGAGFSVSAGEKIGIVGPNGCGKTTLLKMIQGAVTADRGTISFVGSPSVAFLPQHILDFGGNTTVGELLAPAFAQASASLSVMEKKLQHDDGTSEAVLAAYNRAYENFEQAGGYTFESRLEAVMRDLGLSAAIDFTRDLSTLSGGQLTKLALARVLLQEADLLLLDEPTNNLDTASLQWLEKALTECASACLIVSHDRHFLDQITTRTLVIDPQTAAMADYGGNYSFYRLRQQQEVARQWREYEVQQRKIRRLTEDVRAVKQQAEATENSTVNDYLRGRSKKVAAKAKAREHRLTRMIEHEKIDKPRDGEQTRMRLNLQGRRQYDSPLIVAQEVGFGYEHQILVQATFEVVGSARILLSGNNGCGKSTLLKLITGQLEPDSGAIVRKPTAKICYLPQQQETLTGDLSALDFLRAQTEPGGHNWASDAHLRTFLHRFQFSGDQVFNPVARLSRGERTKLMLAAFMAAQPDLLIMDEPTNHLDLPTVELLEEALQHFQGALLFVSHDRYFIERIQPDYIWCLAGGLLQVTHADTVATA